MTISTPSLRRFGNFATLSVPSAGVQTEVLHHLWARNVAIAPGASTDLTVFLGDLSSSVSQLGLIYRIWNTGAAAFAVSDVWGKNVGTIATGSVGLVFGIREAERGIDPGLVLFRMHVLSATARPVIT